MSKKYQAGDQVEVCDLPENQVWFSPRGKYDLVNGDILTIIDPPFDIYGRLRYDIIDHTIIRGTINPEWVRPVGRTSTPKMCSCDIMVMGCVCGVFQEEEEKRNG